MGSPPFKERNVSNAKSVGSLSPDKKHSNSDFDFGSNPIVIILAALSMIIILPILFLKFFKKNGADSKTNSEPSETPEETADSEGSQETITDPESIEAINEKIDNIEQ